MKEREYFDYNPEFDRILLPVEDAEHGKPRADIFQKCVDLADKNNDRIRQMRYRILLCDENTFYDDALKTYIIYPVLLKISDEYYKETGRNPLIYNILWIYKHLASNARNFYQIKPDQFEKLLEDAVNRFKRAGFGPRSLYMQAALYYVNSDKEKAEEYYKLFLASSRDDLSDCPACERDNEFDYLLSLNRYEEAMQKAEPILAEKLVCTDVPGLTYIRYLLYMSEKCLKGEIISEGVLSQMTDYAFRVRKIFVNEHLLVEQAGILLVYYALFEPEKALGYIKIFYNYTEKNQYNPFAVFYFSLGMILFIKGLGEKETYKMKINSGFRFYNSDNVYDLEEMKKYYSDRAKEIADSFVEAKGNDNLKKMYDSVMSF